MDFKSLIEKLDSEMYLKLKTSIELGKFPDGRVLTEEQKNLCLQAIIAYEIENNFPEDERTGYLPSKSTPCDSSSENETPIKWQS